MPYLVKGDEKGDVVLICENSEEGKLHPEEVSGEILSHLLAHVEQTKHVSINKAVVSVRSLLSAS